MGTQITNGARPVAGVSPTAAAAAGGGTKAAVAKTGAAAGTAHHHHRHHHGTGATAGAATGATAGAATGATAGAAAGAAGVTDVPTLTTPPNTAVPGTLAGAGQATGGVAALGTAAPTAAAAPATTSGAVPASLQAQLANVFPASASQGATTINDPQLAAVRQAAAASPISTTVLSALSTGNVPVHILPDAEFNQIAPGAGAFFDQDTGITMPQSALQTPKLLALELTHEGTHYLDHLSSVGVDTTPLTGGSPLLASTDTAGQTDGTKQYGWDTELHAYTVEAQAAPQLGIQDQGLGTNADGTVRTAQQTLAAIESNPLYANG